MDNKRENITERELVLQDIELCKKLAPIMERKGIERDWAFDWEDLGSVEYPEGYYLVHPDEYNEYEDYDSPTWRLDKLLLELADWCFNPDTYAVDAGSWSEPETEYIVRWDVHGTIDMEFLFTKVHPLLKKTFFGETNKIRLESAARLLILLEENNLNE